MQDTAPSPAGLTAAPAHPAAPANPASTRFGIIDLALLAMVVIWGINAVVVKATYAQIPPVAFMVVRFVVAATVLIGIVLAAEHSVAIRRRDWLLLVGVGLVGTSLYQPLFLTGLSITTASSTSLLIATSPAFVALINRALGREQLAVRGWLGIGLAFVGILLIVESGGGLELTGPVLMGDLMILVSAFFWALYVVLAAPLMERYSPLRVTALTTSIGALPLILIGIPSVAALDWSQVTWTAWAGVLFSAVFAIAIAYVIWNSGVKKIGGARTAFYTNLIPVVGMIAAALILGETITLSKIAGAAVIFAGLYLARTAKTIIEPAD